MAALIGSQLIGSKTSRANEDTFHGINPETGKSLQPPFAIATEAEVNEAADRAHQAFPKFFSMPKAMRARLLRRIATEIESLGEKLIDRAHQETGLPEARLLGERARTCNQLRMFADLVEEGSWVDARIDHADPQRTPPKPDLRRMLVPLGPVAVFGASNFPFAFSVAGGDTASALAAGCPVVAKAHPSHPGTSELMGRAIVRSAVGEGMPDGVFSLLQGPAEVGGWLVRADSIEAVGFTGSLSGGRALIDLAAKRLRPIPVFAEMGSINPVIILPGAIRESAEQIANGYADSLLLGCGQFCTNPGLLIGIAGAEFRSFIEIVGKRVAEAEPGIMLSPQIAETYRKGVAELSNHPELETVGAAPPMRGSLGSPILFSTNAKAVASDPLLQAEIFGPAGLAVECDDIIELLQLVAGLEGQLTGSIFFDPAEEADAIRVADSLRPHVGRLLFNGFPTGVEVSPAMQHGGPFPASSDSRFTSVGTAAIYRWVRPVCWQNAPESGLPDALKESNPAGIRRTVNGALQLP